MDEYGPNSYKFKEEQKVNNPSEKKIEKVVTGAAKLKKKSEMKRLADVFISEDIDNVKTYILMDVLVPAVKKAISDIVTNGIDMILYGETSSARNKTNTTRIAYGKMYDQNSDLRRDYQSNSRSGYDWGDIIFETRGDAESVLDAMNDIIGQYGIVSVGDLYDLAGKSTDNYNLNKYGWTDISGCKSVRVREGYILKLPKALPLN